MIFWLNRVIFLFRLNYEWVYVNINIKNDSKYTGNIKLIIKMIKIVNLKIIYNKLLKN